MTTVAIPILQRMNKHSISTFLRPTILPSLSHLISPLSHQPNYYSSSSIILNKNDTNKEKPRNKTIIMNPKGYSYQLQPNNQIYRVNTRKGNIKQLVQIDRVYGFFWMLKDLRENDGKPVLGHESLVPEMEAEVLPRFEGLETLDGCKIDAIPDVFIRSQGKATLLMFSFKDFGYQMLPSWLDPIRAKFHSSKPKLQIITINITEGSSIFSLLFKKFVLYSMKQNTPKELHSTTYTYFGDMNEFRDLLRMHNTYTAYVVLIDKFGRVRWMGSGNATQEEVGNLCNGIEELIG